MEGRYLLLFRHRNALSDTLISFMSRFIVMILSILSQICM